MLKAICIPPPQVFVIHEDPSVRESLSALIADSGWTPNLFASACAFNETAKSEGPGCLVLNPALPGLDCVKAHDRITARSGPIPILFIAGEMEVLLTSRATKEGGIDYIAKPYSDEALVAAMREAIERSQALLHAREKSERARQDYESLTPRERDVMRLIASGLLNKQVGGELGIAEQTVKAHRGNVMRKMGARSFADLVDMAVGLGVRQEAFA